MSFLLDELVVPESLDAPGADDFLAYVRVRNAVEARPIGYEGGWLRRPKDAQE